MAIQIYGNKRSPVLSQPTVRCAERDPINQSINQSIPNVQKFKRPFMEPTKASLGFIKRERVMTRNASRVPTKYEASRFNAFKGVDDPRSVQVTEKRQNKTPFPCKV